MKRITIVPEGWACMIEECPPGFFWYDNALGFKSEYSTKRPDGTYTMDAFCDSGEFFMPREVEVQPVTYVVENVEE